MRFCQDDAVVETRRRPASTAAENQIYIHGHDCRYRPAPGTRNKKNEWSARNRSALSGPLSGALTFKPAAKPTPRLPHALPRGKFYFSTIHLGRLRTAPARATCTENKGATGMSLSSAAATPDAPPEITIRTCRKSDLDVVRAFRQDLRAELELSDDDTADELSLNEYVLIAEKDSEPIGFVAARQQMVELTHAEVAHAAFTEDDHYLEIRELYVVPRYREKGVGSLLVRTELERARKNGIPRSMVCTAGGRSMDKVRFYEQCGYTISHVYMTQ